MGKLVKNIKQKKPSVFYFSLFCSLVFVIFCPMLADVFNLPKFIVATIGISSFLSYLAVRFLNIHTITIYKNPLYLPLGLFILWQIYGLIFSTNKIYGITQISLFVLCAFLIFIVPLILREFEDILFFTKFLVLCSFFTAIYGIFQHFGFDFFLWEMKNSALSTFGRRNFAAEFLVLILPWSLFVILSTKGKEKIFFVFNFLILLFHLFLTFTRASWIGFGFSILLICFLFFRFQIKQVLLMIFLFLFFVLSSYADVFQFEKGTLKSRLLIWKNSIEMIKHKPIAGYGTGNFEVSYYQFAFEKKDVFIPPDKRIDRVHNEFIEIAVENGIIGLALFLFFIFSIYKMAHTVLKGRNSNNEKLIIAFAIASISGILVNAGGSFPLQTTSGCFFFFLNCGILSRSYFNFLKQKPVEKKFFYPGIVFLCMAVICTIIVFSFAVLYSSYSLKKSKRLMKLTISNKDPVLWLFAEMYGKNAISYNPFSLDAYFHLGEIYLAVNELEKAQECFIKAMRFNPYSEQIFTNLGIIEQRKQNFDKAEEYFLKALAVNENSPLILKTVGKFYLEKKEFEKSIYYLEKAQKLDPQNPDILTVLSNAIKAYKNER